MKIAHLTPSFSAFSGIDRVVYMLAAQEKEKGHGVTVFALTGDMEPPKNVELQLMALPWPPLWQRIYRLILPLNIYGLLKWVPKLKDFDVIYSHQYPMTWLGYLARKFYGVRYIYYNYGIATPGTFPSLIERTYMRIFHRLTIWTIKKADGVISISQYLQQQLTQEVGLAGKVAYPEIDTRRFHRGLDGSQVRDRYNLVDNPLTLFVGRISSHKGVHLLIEAFNLVRREIPGAKLLIVGKHTFPCYSKKLREMADDSIIFTGYVPDEEIPYYYAACDVYATATMWEGFNLPLAEAQACGKPVVAFHIGPHPEVVKDGETGFLIPHRDTSALAKAIINLLGNDKLRQDMGENAYKVVRGMFSRGGITK